MKKMVNKNEGVSPVVGVMLMLVVTIIIAAVVSGFAGGLAGGTEVAPRASISISDIVINEAYDTDLSNGYPNLPTDKCSDVYVVFEHMGGDGINLNNIEIHLKSLQYEHQGSFISNTKAVNTTLYGDHDDIELNFSEGWSRYIEGFPDKATTISPGSKFVLHADYVRGFDGTSSSYPKGESISWKADGDAGSFDIRAGDYLIYDIIDKKSQKSIASGQIQVRDFSVASS